MDTITTSKTAPGLMSTPKTIAAPKPANADALKTAPIVGELKRVPIGTLAPSKLNPRKHFDAAALRELEDSIAASGVLQPLVARPRVGIANGLELIIGERRYRACVNAEKAKRLPADFTVPVIVHSCTDRELVLLAATENLQRKDMHPLDEGALYKALIEQDITGEQISAKLGVPLRTIRRRCALLKCAPDVQTAFREGRLTAQQAEAFALGAAARQQSYLKQLKRDGDDAWRGDWERIRDDMVQNLLPVTHALFERALYKGEIVENGGVEFFADSAQTQKLQNAAIAAKIAEIRNKWPWVKTVKQQYEFDYNFSAAPKDKNAGAVLWIDLPYDAQGRAKFHVRAPVIDKRERERKAMQAQTARNVAKEKERTGGLSHDHLTDVYAAKTMALRAAMIGNRRAALALAVIGFAGFENTDVIPMERYDGEDFGAKLNAADANRRAKALTPLVKLLGHKKLPCHFYNGNKLAAAALEKLMTWSEADLAETLAALLAGAVSVADQSGDNVGDEPLTLALAAATGAAIRLGDYWNAPKAYVEHLPAPRKAMIGAGRDVTFFPEVAFGDEATIKKTIEAQTKAGEKLVAAKPDPKAKPATKASKKKAR